MKNSHILWDWPTRMFHWLLVIAIPAAWWTAEEGHMKWHEWIGMAVLVLLLFRVGWGFFGSRASRFGSFVRGPGRVIDYIKGDSSQVRPGHNPLGGWSVLTLIALLFVQVVSGLFNSDEVFFDGPLRHLASSAWQDRFGALHELVFNILLAFIALHIAAVVWHQWKHKEPLVKAMVHGRAEGKTGEEAAVASWRAVLWLVLVIAAVWGGLSLVPEPVSYW